MPGAPQIERIQKSALFWLFAAMVACPTAAPRASDNEPALKAGSTTGDHAHAAVFDEAVFPSAQACGVCHTEHYREWSVSPHAYAQISPTFNAYHATLGVLTNGTLGDFCERCHTQVGMTAAEPVITPNSNRSDVAREGVTCVVCHRVSEAYGKISGRLPLEAGDIESPIYGPRPDDELRRVLTSPDEFEGFSPETGTRQRKIHRQARMLEQLSHPGFCGRCHDVRLPSGFRLEDALSEYKQTDAAKRGESCQACHMGPVPGVPSEYPPAPAAVVGGAKTRPARRTNHMFVGPDDPLVHPGIFPHDAEAAEYVTPLEWVSFDYQAGWGTDEFEATEPGPAEFPELWADPDERSYARAIIDRQLALRAEAHERGTTLLRNGYGLGEIQNLQARDGLKFAIEVRNETYGHSVPTGLIAERNVFLQVSVHDAEGAVVFRSGDLDPNGDVRDMHSLYVHSGVVPRDKQLFNLRSPFMIRLAHGGEREQVLPANYSFDPLVFIRPSTTPSVLFGGVRGARLQKRNIEALGHRWARYTVETEELTGKAPYTVRVALVAGQLPPHLIHAISGVGFEYGLSARTLSEAIVAGYRVLWERSVVLDAK